LLVSKRIFTIKIYFLSKFITGLKHFSDLVKQNTCEIFSREIYEAQATVSQMYYAPLRVTLVFPRVPGPDDTDFDWSHESEAFLFP